MSQFDNRKNLALTADAPSYTARITPGSYSWTATISYKPGWKVGPPSVTAKDSDTLMGELTRLDSAVKFYKTGNDTGALSAKDSAALEAMRTDLSVSDVRYRSACRAFGQKPQPRPTQAATTTAAQQPLVPFYVQGAAWGAFMQAHGELFVGVFAEQNAATISQYLTDFQLQSDAASLDQAYRELKAANCFRDARTLSRDLKGSLSIVQPYSHDRIVAMRCQQVAAQQNAAPSNLSEVDASAWNYVAQNHPGVLVGSPAFKQLCSQQVLAWAKDYAIDADPSLAAADKRGQLSVAINRVLVAWSRNPNLGQGQKTIKDTRVWLG